MAALTPIAHRMARGKTAQRFSTGETLEVRALALRLNQTNGAHLGGDLSSNCHWPIKRLKSRGLTPQRTRHT